jgi:hypothetical protein
VLPASGELPIGTEGRFAILLRDRSVAMRGRCRVTDAKPAPAGASGAGVRRTMLRVALLDMDDATRAVHQRLIASQRPPVPIMVAQALSERTEVSAPRPEPQPRAVVAPPIAVRPVVPPPFAGLAPAPAGAPKASPMTSPKVSPTTSPKASPTTSPKVSPTTSPKASPMTSPTTSPAAPPRPVATHVAPLRTVTPAETPARGGTARGPAPAIPASAPPAAGQSPVAPPAAARPSPSASSFARAPTLIGVPSARSTDGTMTRASQDATITAVAVPPPQETRAPGASFTLPANPLSELGPDDLASFIDCTLFESVDEVEAVVADDAGPTVEIDPLAPARPFVIPGPGAEGWLAPALAPAAAKQPAPPRGPQARLLQLAKSYGIYAACVVGGLVVGLAILRPARVQPPAAAPAPAPAAPAARAPEPVETPPPEIAPAPKPAEVVAAPKSQKPAEAVAPPKPAEAVAAPKRPEAVAPPKPAEVVAVAKPVEAVAPKAAEAASAPKPISAAPKAAVAVPKAAVAAPKAAAGGAGDGCLVRVVSEPGEARVLWGSKLIGVTPLESARVPCGAASVTLRRDRYQPVTRDVTATADETTVVSQKLHRPGATLIVGSSPPHAEITVNGQPQGFTPKRISVSRYESVSIHVALAGYAPWKKTIYVRQEETHLGMQLGHADAGKRPAGH